MAAYAYLRVSTDQQDTDKQKHGILEYANQHGISGMAFIEDTASGRTSWRERKSGELLQQTVQAGDVLVFAEVSRMARSTLQVLEMLECAASKGVQVHIAKQKLCFDDSMNSRITATVLGLAAEIEREFISMRTKEALAKLKAEGKTLGRPKGKATRLMLDKHEKEIRGWLKKGVSKRAIARLLECSETTLYEWLKRRRVSGS